MRLLFLTPLLPLLFGAAAVPSKPAVMTPVAVELFTSQGCSSCPPADALIERLAKEPNIIALVRPVTYWDRLGWKDTLAREDNASLQRRYASRGGEGAGVYTPQAVVQGGSASVGSDEKRLRRLIVAEKQKPGPSVMARGTSDGGRDLTIGRGAGAASDVTLVALRHEAVVRIGSGENGGRTVRYTNIVLAERNIGLWTGAPVSIRVAGAERAVPGADGYAVLIRERASGRIVAARYI